jgi:HSF-type DNA-binding
MSNDMLKKRPRDVVEDAIPIGKVSRTDFSPSQSSPIPEGTGTTQVNKNGDKATQDDESLRPYPYFYYQDYSTVPDPNPSVPLTSAGKVPNFPAKMHAILSRADFQDVISWMPHGRAWRVHKPKDFESRVIPLYFEHVKYSSFVRQANGWGFHRITVDSRDRNGYYHPLFLRGLPHLCKNMKRPGISKKQSLNPDFEPDLYEISKHCPVPDKVVDDSVLLSGNGDCAPNIRIPILTMNSSFSNTLVSKQAPSSTMTTLPDTNAPLLNPIVSLQKQHVVSTDSLRPLNHVGQSSGYRMHNKVSSLNHLSECQVCYYSNKKQNN